MSSGHKEIDPALRVSAEQVAANAIYIFRNTLSGASPELKLVAAKALLSKVRTMVEDLEMGVNSNGNSSR